MQSFTTEELSAFNGKDGAKAYTSYEGKVYDVTGSTLWKLGEHFGLQAGKDLTADMANAPHGDEVFSGFTQIGVLEGFETAEDSPMAEEPLVAEDEAMTPMPEQSKPWYSGRLRFLGISVLGWTGILLGIFFVFTFGTCFAMPWAQMKLPWVGEKPGTDPLDATGVHKPWTAVHKYFVWFTVIFGVVHGILGF
ncbi:hypothetical protein KC721_02020, partial [Candidatus Woesebacteria bacterium]|nr:hypothetical protein [Candidatus Woesebacteria bacterium]